MKHHNPIPGCGFFVVLTLSGGLALSQGRIASEESKLQDYEARVIGFSAGRVFLASDVESPKVDRPLVVVSGFQISASSGLTLHGSFGSGYAGAELTSPMDEPNVAEEVSATLPKEFALEQNYPNPFNPTTIIKYQLPVTSKVSLKVYNLLGQVVSTLVDEIEDAGFKSVSWNAIGVASGVYFYRLVAGSFVETKKMLFLK